MDAMDKPTVLVTGASGLIGTRVCRELGSDHRVVGLDVKRPRGPTGVPWVDCDLTDDTSVGEAFAEVERRFGERIASVIHLAAYYDFSGEESPLYDELTVEGTRRLLRALQRLEVEQLVFSSSLLVMRPTQVGKVLDESAPVEATWEYPRSKLAAERVIGEEAGAIRSVVLRIAGVYDENGHSLPIAQQIWRIHGRTLESFFFPGKAEHGQSFVHLEDLMRCLRAVVERRRRLGPHELFLIGEPETLSYGELQDLIGEQIHGREWPTIRIPKPVAKAGAWLKDKAGGEESFIKPWMIDMADAHRPISIERARRLLGWTPTHALRRTIPEMVQRMLSDPDSWYAENGLEVPPRAEQAG
jgi:nucleoside-diphosphate-sugar epimerase